MTKAELKQAHDLLLQQKPDDASHDSASCAFCLGDSTSEPGGDVSGITEEDYEALLAEKERLEAQLSERESAAAIEAMVNEVTAAKDAEIAELQSKLDASVLEGEKAKNDLAALTTFLDEEQERAEQEAEIASRREQRIAAVREVAAFPDSYLQQNADRWAAMDEGTFDAALADWKAIGARPAGPPSSTTSLHFEREYASLGNGSNKELLAEVLHDWRKSGIDPREL